jgi:hypothetical protein
MKTMNMSEVMKLKRELQANCDIDAKMLDTSEDGFVLFVERKTVPPESYKRLADFAAQRPVADSEYFGRLGLIA